MTDGGGPPRAERSAVATVTPPDRNKGDRRDRTDHGGGAGEAG
ncbi:hypothetical protein GZL_06354 [Streptomyces sp. 769]|nr:hypothetical protein GZL_06354 [Streptomyces sp. 769]